MKKYLDAIKTLNAEEFLNATTKEASREVGEMERWMKVQEKFDPEGMAEHYEDEIFPLIKKAAKYRMRIYNKNKLIAKIPVELGRARSANDPEAEARVVQSALSLDDDLIMLAWRIRKIYCKVRSDVTMMVGGEDEGGFKEFEYDPEKH